MQVQLGDDTTYPIIGKSYISFGMSSRDVIELHNVLLVHGLTKYLLSVSYLTYIKCITKFDDEQVIIKICNPRSSGGRWCLTTCNNMGL